METNNFYDMMYNDDCLKVMPTLPNECCDAIICDLPYGTTRNKWDSVIPLQPLWKEYERIIKDRGAIVLFSQMPFSATLVASNPRLFKYEWIWQKQEGTGFLNSRFAPLKAHENILVFGKSAAAFVRDSNNAMIYNPQMRPGKAYVAKHGQPSTNYDSKHMRVLPLTHYKAERYPIDVLKFNRDTDHLHPTQKPVDLVRYLIRTYTETGGGVVLDNTMGSGSTCVAAALEKRHFIGIEKEKKYYDIAVKRVLDAKREMNTLFNNDF